VPEGDVVRLTAERLGQALRGSPLVRAELRWPSAAAAHLVGSAVVESLSYGKHLLLRLDDGRTLHTHLRMEGSWRVARTGSPQAAARAPTVRAVLATASWTCLGDRLGMLDLVRTHDEVQLLGHLGPDVLAENFEGPGVAEGLRRLALEPERAACAALLDQTVVAGIGTIWMAESLFARRLWPWTPVAGLGPDERSALLRTASRLISRSVDIGRRQGLGAVPRYAHGRHRKPCPRCRTPIALAALSGPDVRPDQGAGEGVVFWCPSCQARRAPAPGAAVRECGS